MPRARSVVLRAEGPAGAVRVRIRIRVALLRELLRDGKVTLLSIGPRSDARPGASLAELLAGSIALLGNAPAPPTDAEWTNVLLDVRPSND